MNELGKNFIDLDSIHLLNKLKSHNLDSNNLLNEYFDSILLIHLV